MDLNPPHQAVEQPRQKEHLADYRQASHPINVGGVMEPGDDAGDAG